MPSPRFALAAPVLLAALLLAMPSARASSTGPQPASTGVPAGGGFEAEATCTACHGDRPLNPDTRGGIELLGLPERYEPGRRYALRFRIHHADPAVARWGFQLTAVSARQRIGAGDFALTDPATTQIVDGPQGRRRYVQHAYGGTGVGQQQAFEWRFEWIAPDPALGRVAFYGVGNAANMDGAQGGDRIFAPTPEPLATVEPRGLAPALPTPTEAP